MKNIALLLIDIQKGFENEVYWGGHRNNPRAERNAASLLGTFRDRRLPVFHIKHNSLNPDSPLFSGKPGNDLQEMVAPRDHEPVIEKHVNSAFIGTDLEQRLRKQGISAVVVAGLTTEHCVSTTVRMAANLGFEVLLVENATATFDKSGPGGKYLKAELIHEVELACLHNEFARIISTEDIADTLAAG